MKKFRLITALTLALLLVLGTPLSAMAASWDVTDSQGVYDAFANDTDAEVIINMQNDIDMEDMLTAGEGQSYIINGNGNTIADVRLDGAGSVEINADVTTKGDYFGIDVMEDVDVTVNGDITSDQAGLYISDDASVTVNGDVTAAGDTGAYVFGGTLTVNGDVSSESTGIIADYGATVTVQGNVDANEGQGIEAWGEDVTVDVTGNVTGGYSGVNAYDGAEVSIDGDVTGKDGDGVSAYGGDVTVNGNVSGSYSGVSAGDGASVTVTGSVIGNEDTGISAWDDDTTVDVTGDVTGENGGLIAADGAVLNVEGNVTGNNGYGIDTWGEGSVVTVNGNVSGADGIAASEGTTVTVIGDVTAVAGEETVYAGNGIYAMGDAVVTVDGNVAGADAVATDEALLQDPNYGEFGGFGVFAENEAQVTVTGNVDGGDGLGAVGVGGAGVQADDEAVVSIGGNVTGGDVIADPEVKLEGEEIVIDEEGNTETFYWNVSSGGVGIYASADATITVGGNVTGGSTNADHGNGGDAIHMNDYNYKEGELYEGVGKLDVKGVAAGGAAGPEGEGGTALFLNSCNGFLASGDVDFEEILNAPAGQVTDEDLQVIDFMINSLLMSEDLTIEEVNQVMDDVYDQFTEYTTDEEALAVYYGAFRDLILSKNPDFEAMEENVTVYGEIIIGTLSDENGPKMGSSLGQEAAERYAKDGVKELTPTGDNPRTGDGFSGIFVVLMVASVLGFGVLVSQRKRFV